MRSSGKIRVRYCFLAVLAVLLIVINIACGSSAVTPVEAIMAIPQRFLPEITNDTAYRIVWEIRAPRILAAFILGGALAVSGYLLQTFFGNPIAGPFVLGISSGAKLFVAIVMILFLQRGWVLGSWTMILSAFAGAMSAIAIVLLLADKVRNMSILVICGVMISNICSSVTEILVTFADDSNIVNLHNWSMGSFSGISWENVRVMTLLTCVAIGAAVSIGKPMAAYLLGEENARSMGVNIKKFRFELILLSGILSACVAAFAGPISFAGVAVPHLMRSLFRTNRPLVMIPGCFLGGAVLCLFADLTARTLFAPTELSISTVTAVICAPVVIRVMVKRRK